MSLDRQPLTVAGLVDSPETPGPRRRRSPRSLGASLSAAFILVLILCALLGPLLPWAAMDQSVGDRLLGPWERDAAGTLHILGTDPLGRDSMALLFAGARVSMLIAVATVLIAGCLGTVLGLVAGYFGGTTQVVLMRAVDVIAAFPSLLLALVILFVTGAGLFNVVMVLAITRLPAFARVVDALAQSSREDTYVAAARTIGCGHLTVVFRHILPNISTNVLALAALEVAVVIPAEASLSFLGLGVQAPDTSWGIMIADGRAYLAQQPWIVIFPSIAILLTTLSLNLLAKRARDVAE
jgi:peptide/nickel transport system permease protein